MGVGTDSPLVVDPDSAMLFELPVSGPTRRVLVVDDDRDIRELLAHKLSLAGFEVVTVDEGAAALDAVEAEPFDLILLDVAMPGISGIDVCRQLREDPRTADVPIIMLTARTHATFATLGYMAGADMYLSKPFSPRELVDQVRALLDGRVEPPPVVPDLSETEPAADPAAQADVYGRRPARWLRRD